MIKDYIAFDLETTGLRVEEDDIIEIGAVKVRNGKVCDRFIEFLKPTKTISSLVTSITGITNEMVSNARDTEQIIIDFMHFCEDDVLVGHNIMFDYKFMKTYAKKYGFSFEKRGIDTLKIARKAVPSLPSKKLEDLCLHYQIINQAAHRAYHDALATAKVYHMLAHDYEMIFPDLFIPNILNYKPPKKQPCTKKQLLFLESLCETHHIPFPKGAEDFTRSEASRYIDRIISKEIL